MRSTAYAVASVLAAAAPACAAENYTWANPPSELPYYGQSPPVYPSPQGTGNSSTAWATAYEKARAIVQQLTLDEKSNLTRGFTGTCVGNTGAIPRLGIEPFCLADAPDGIRGSDFVSAFPSQLHLATTWDRDLMYAYGKALGEEYHDKGINIALGPVAGPLGRIAKGGRNWEGLSNDPYLAGIGMYEVTKAMQDAGVIAVAKHFLLNEQEYRRMPNQSATMPANGHGVIEANGHAISSNVDDKTIHELYAWPFYDSLKAGAASVMCAYSRANNSYSCSNSKLLNGLLKTEMGFEGFVVSDWQAQHTGIASANAGLDLVMPDGGYWGANLTQAVNNGSVSIDRLNDMATRVLAAHYLLGQDEDFPETGVFPDTVQHPIVDVRGEHDKVIREVGSAGHVLVKNVNNTLPLKNPKFVAVYGYGAEVKAAPWENVARYGGGYEVNYGWNTFNGTLITGGGSGGASPPYVISPFKAIQDRVIQDHGIVRWNFWDVNPHVSATASVCFVFINAYASESFDRPSLTDDFSDQLVNNVATNCSNTVVVVHSAGIRIVDSWIEHENITAVIFAGLPGQESGHSLVDILYGDVSPSGKLTYTVAKTEEDYGLLLNHTEDQSWFPQDNFTEGVYIDYKAFDKDGIEPRFEFGYGLSYSEFEYSNIQVSSLDGNTDTFPSEDVAIVQGGHPALWDVLFNVTAEIENIGNYTASEVAQLYVGIPTGPVRQLRGFDKVATEPGQKVTATFPLKRRDLSVWNVVAQQWELQSGEYPIWVGASSRDLRLNATITI
ncbi:putative beta-glucosidase 1 protein [Botryosphaeria dothidea]|uniref:beta-glucosidase n=1 Tax=Botryosphaeria dothidea TaxID=55169 RepID=A0A8H4N4I9_9PEZI|nr:putative beta-glucosidase 1 protein [Botryosphaeria dothidea]KAF4305696.1 putative beta-glucosidase 1 protein [Botryosphaeria dothidea]